MAIQDKNMFIIVIHTSWDIKSKVVKLVTKTISLVIHLFLIRQIGEIGLKHNSVFPHPHVSNSPRIFSMHSWLRISLKIDAHVRIYTSKCAQMIKLNSYEILFS